MIHTVFLELIITCNSLHEEEIEKIKDIIHPSDLSKVKYELEENDEYITEPVF